MCEFWKNCLKSAYLEYKINYQTVWRPGKHAMKSSQINSGFRHQSASRAMTNRQDCRLRTV